MGTIRVLAPGLLSTFQDSGRKGFRKFGVPLSGAMDAYSYRLANILLDNPEDTAVLEITLQGPSLQFDCTTMISLVGADMSAFINDRAVVRNKVIEIRKGDQLSFKKLISGCRIYLAIKGGFEVDRILDSYSYYPGVADKNILKQGMVFDIVEYSANVGLNASVKIDPDHLSSSEIHVQRGPEFELLSEHQLESLFSKPFSVSSRNNRMGYQLEGNPIDLPKDFNMLTSVTIPGTVQLTPAGNPIVLMRDCQTTGGYPRILQLTEMGINRLAQKKTNDLIRFQLT